MYLTRVSFFVGIWIVLVPGVRAKGGDGADGDGDGHTSMSTTLSSTTTDGQSSTQTQTQSSSGGWTTISAGARSGHVNAGVVAGVAVGLAVLIALVIGAFLLRRRRRDQQRQREARRDVLADPASAASDAGSGAPPYSPGTDSVILSTLPPTILRSNPSTASSSDVKGREVRLRPPESRDWMEDGQSATVESVQENGRSGVPPPSYDMSEVEWNSPASIPSIAPGEHRIDASD